MHQGFKAPGAKGEGTERRKKHPRWRRPHPQMRSVVHGIARLEVKIKLLIKLRTRKSWTSTSPRQDTLTLVVKQTTVNLKQWKRILKNLNKEKWEESLYGVLDPRGATVIKPEWCCAGRDAKIPEAGYGHPHTHRCA